jgi:hypothetical protein
MSDELRARFAPDYDAAFSRYVSRPGEGGLAAAYEIGRAAVARGLSLLDVSAMHHAALLRELRAARRSDGAEGVVMAASAFFREVLATFEIARRGFLEAVAGTEQDAPGPER